MKIYYYTVLAGVLMSLFYLAGFDTTSSFIFTRMSALDLSNYQSSSFWILIGSLLTTVGVGVLIGTFTNVSPQYIVKSTIILPVLVLLILDIFSILNLVSGWVYWVMWILIGSLGYGYAIALIEFWEARD